MDDDGPIDGRFVVLHPDRPPRKRGSTGVQYTRELGEEICEAVANSDLSIEALCEVNQHWPRHWTISRWKKEYSEFGELLNAASEWRCELMLDRIPQIIADESKDILTDDKGRITLNPVAVARATIKVNGTIQYVKRRHPYRWGDRVDVNASLGYMSQDEAIKHLK